MAEIRYGVCNAMYEVANEDIESLPQELLNDLDCGDTIIKRTGNMKHCYWVSYKEAGVGICISTCACGIWKQYMILPMVLGYSILKMFGKRNRW